MAEYTHALGLRALVARYLPRPGSHRGYAPAVIVETVVLLLQELQALKDWQEESIHGALSKVAAVYGLKLGKVAQPLRVALTGTAVSPSIDKTARLLGRERTLERLMSALQYLERERDNPLTDKGS